MTKILNILFALIFCATSSFAAKEALLIANADYSHFGKLPNPVSDARQLGDVLRQIGFNVQVVENASREAMLDALSSFEERLKASRGIAFFHYGGHGVQVDGRNFLIPADADIPDEKRVATRAVDVDEIMGALDASGSSVNVVVLDACRNNPLPATSTRSATRGLSVVAAKPKNSIIIYAAEAGNKAQDGLFTPTLAKALAVPGRLISEVMTDVRREVYERSGGSQTPGEYNQLFEQVYLGNSPGQVGEHGVAPTEPAGSASATHSPPSPSNSQDGPVEGTAILSESTAFAVRVGGKVAGGIKAPVGALVKISEVSAGKAFVKYANAEPVWIEQSKLKDLQLGAPQVLTQRPAPPPVASSVSVVPNNSSRRATSLVLEGSQNEQTVLVGAGMHQLRGQYSVSNGQKIVIASGAQIVAERDASISISGGSLAIEGTPESPVVFSGASTAAGSWGGLIFNDASSVDITHARISGADIGITLTACSKAFVTSTSVTRCNVGMLLQNRTKVTIEDCVIANNRGSGIRDNMSEPLIVRTTIANNREWGYFCEYYGSPRFDACIITDNKLGGIQGAIYDAYSEAHNSIIDGNGKVDVVHKGTKDWDYSGCWWGEDNTKRLVAGGESVNLRSIEDQLDDPKVARVRIEGFLKEKPAKVGSSLPLPE